jgi:hypothetical protein
MLDVLSVKIGTSAKKFSIDYKNKKLAPDEEARKRTILLAEMISLFDETMKSLPEDFQARDHLLQMRNDLSLAQKKLEEGLGKFSPHPVFLKKLRMTCSLSDALVRHSVQELDTCLLMAMGPPPP